VKATIVHCTAKTVTVEVERKGTTYVALLTDCCGRPYIASRVYRKPTVERGHPKRDTGGKLRDEIEARASAEVEAWLDEE